MSKKCNFVAPASGLCKSPINKNDKYCDEIPVERCYYKQLQQLKALLQKYKDKYGDIDNE